jgi:hypothetical protein
VGVRQHYRPRAQVAGLRGCTDDFTTELDLWTNTRFIPPELCFSPERAQGHPSRPKPRKMIRINLSTLFARLRASLSFRGFHAGGVVAGPEAQKIADQEERAMQLLEDLEETRPGSGASKSSSLGKRHESPPPHRAPRDPRQGSPWSPGVGAAHGAQAQ